jgi:leader peptidase (prepilin peptidase)/N-methyltransferase
MIQATDGEKASLLHRLSVAANAISQTASLRPRQAVAAISIGGVIGLSSLLLGDSQLIVPSFVLVFGLTWAAAVDIDRMILPNPLTIGLLVVGLAFEAFHDPEDLADHVIGPVAGYFALVSISLLYRKLRGVEGIGMGDAKLLAAGGAWLGWMALPFSIAIAATLALLWSAFRGGLKPGQRDQRLAFGPFIGLGIWVCWILPNLWI